MKQHRHFPTAALGPLAIIGISLWLLIGCIYIPTPKILHLTGSRKDFRSMVGAVGSQRPIVSRRISRAAVETLLGPPPFASENRRRLMYVIHEKSGLWIMPLCWTITDNSDQAIGLVLNFDETGMLREWEQIHASDNFNVIQGRLASELTLRYRANDPPLQPGVSATRTGISTAEQYSGPCELRSTKAAARTR